MTILKDKLKEKDKLVNKLQTDLSEKEKPLREKVALL